MSRDATRPLTLVDKEKVFRIATRGFVRRFGDRFAGGMSDDELQNALAESLGIYGGSGGPDRMSVIFTGSGLRIWGGWHVVNHVQEKPLFAGPQTLKQAREVYGIADPNDRQPRLL